MKRNCFPKGLFSDTNNFGIFTESKSGLTKRLNERQTNQFRARYKEILTAELLIITLFWDFQFSLYNVNLQCLKIDKNNWTHVFRNQFRFRL